ncbi:MAG: prephenate dehydrogenase [Acidobacteriia bacterium]|nr:prephenate dehydrogenase [Terriglobia bacterium]
MDNDFVGVFGYGRFGKFLCEELQRLTKGRVPLRVYDPAATRDALAAPKFAQTWSGAKAQAKTPSPLEFVTIPEAARAALLIFAVPISELKNALLSAAPHVSEGALVMDVCSVKMKPLEAMKLFLPPHAEILGTHPLFGPDSAQQNRGIKGLKVVLCPVRISPEHLDKVRSMLTSAELQVLVATAEEHDRAMAESQALFHLVARAVAEMDHPAGERQEIITPGPARLFEDLKILLNDTPQLFLDMQRANPFAKELRRRFIERLTEIDRELEID